MYPNQPGQNGPGYPPNQPRQPAPPQYASHEVLPPLNNTGASGHNPYEFIMNPNTKQKNFGFSKHSAKKLVVIFCVALLLVIIVVATLISTFSPKGNTAQLIAIAQRQQEIIRITDEASKQVSTANTANFIASAELTVASSQVEVLNYLAAHGTKLKGTVLTLDNDKQTDTLLTNALAANNYDNTVANVVSDQLDTYQSLLQSAYKLTTSKTGKALLQKTYRSTQMLQAQAKTVKDGS